MPLRRREREYTSITYTDRLDDVGAAPSIGTVGDSFDNAMAETTIGLFKAELHRNPAALAAKRLRRVQTGELASPSRRPVSRPDGRHRPARHGL